MTKVKARRLRKRDTPPDVWKAHRKLRKKIASAKWYAKKKKVLNAKQEELQTALDEAHRQRQRQRLWTTEQFQFWRCSTEHHLHDFPVRPRDIPPGEWLHMIDQTYAAMARMLDAHEDVSWYTRERKRILKGLAMGELMNERRMHVSTSAISPKTSSSSSMWNRWTGGIVPSICSTLGWMITGMITAGIYKSHYPALCQYLQTRDPPSPIATPNTLHMQHHVWLDEDIQHLKRELDRLCTPGDTTLTADSTDQNMDELESIPSSLDSFLNDTFADIGYRNTDSQSCEKDQSQPTDDHLDTSPYQRSHSTSSTCSSVDCPWDEPRVC